MLAVYLQQMNKGLSFDLNDVPVLERNHVKLDYKHLCTGGEGQQQHLSLTYNVVLTCLP